MTETRVLLNDLPGMPQLVIDKLTGVLHPAGGGEVVPLRGCVNRAEGNIFCLYVVDGNLMLQLDLQR